jgi:hypothetical protein
MKIASISCVLLALALSAGNGPVCGVETNETPHVGQLREFDRFTFEGATNFSPSSLWFALNATFDFPELSHPLAPRDVFLATIGSQLRLGYQHCGFPDARITACYNPTADRVVVQVTEGLRYLCGPVEITGARKMPTQPIVTALTVSNADSEILLQPFQFPDHAPANRTAETDTNNSTGQSSLWIARQPAHFDDISRQCLYGKVTNTLSQHGFLLSRISLNVVTNAAARIATLQVKILDEGPPAIIDRIEVVGNQKNSRKTLLDYLGLKPGMGFNRDLAVAINDQLYHSARFLTSSVLAGTPDSSGRLTLTIEVVESDQCPPLNEKFNPVEKTMLKTRDWLAKVGETRDEAVMTVSGYPNETSTIQCILAPRQGLLVLENERTSATNRLLHALVASSSQIALYAPERQQKHVTHFSTHQFKNYVTVETSAPDSDGNCAHFEFGAGLNSLDDSTSAPPYALSMSLAPAAFLRLAYSTNFTCWFDGDQLIRSNADSVLKLDARTGRLIELTIKGEEPRHGQMNLRFVPDAFTPALARVEHDGAGFVNVCQTNAPFGSAVAFFGSELVQLKFVDSFLRARLPAAACAQLPTLFHKLGTGDLFSVLESFKDLQTASNDPAGKFEIPEESRPVSGGSVGAGIEAVAKWILADGDLMFPARSWPWTMSRDIAFLFRGQSKYLQPDMADIFDSSDVGPIGCLAAAHLMKRMEMPLADAMTNRGLARLSTDDFRRDYRLLLDEHYLSGRFAAALAANLRDLDEQDLNALLEPMPAARAEFIRDCAQRLRAAKKDQPLLETIAPALDAFWEKELERDTADNLRKIANE